MFDYKMKSQNESVTTYEYKGTISKNSQSSADKLPVRTSARAEFSRHLRINKVEMILK